MSSSSTMDTAPNTAVYSARTVKWSHREREIGDEAIWTVSSAKAGNGVLQLRDDNSNTFWQSDGIQPHFVNIQFQKRTPISRVSLYVDERLDESYTPAKLTISAGSCFLDLYPIPHLKEITLQKPQGWLSFYLQDPDSTEDPSSPDAPFLRTNLIQIAVLASQQSGRDTHIRQCKIFGPYRHHTEILGSQPDQFFSPRLHAYSTIR